MITYIFTVTFYYDDVLFFQYFPIDAWDIYAAIEYLKEYLFSFYVATSVSRDYVCIYDDSVVPGVIAEELYETLIGGSSV